MHSIAKAAATGFPIETIYGDRWEFIAYIPSLPCPLIMGKGEFRMENFNDDGSCPGHPELTLKLADLINAYPLNISKKKMIEQYYQNWEDYLKQEIKYAEKILKIQDDFFMNLLYIDELLSNEKDSK